MRGLHNKVKGSAPKDREQWPVVGKRRRSPKHCPLSRCLPVTGNFQNVKLTQARKQLVLNTCWPGNDWMPTWEVSSVPVWQWSEEHPDQWDVGAGTAVIDGWQLPGLRDLWTKPEEKPLWRNPGFECSLSSRGCVSALPPSAGPGGVEWLCSSGW